MAYRCGDRYQMSLLPQSIEEYVAEDDPVRAYDAFVDALNFHDLGIEIDRHKVGNAEYDPKSMVKLLVYGYFLIKLPKLTIFIIKGEEPRSP